MVDRLSQLHSLPNKISNAPNMPHIFILDLDGTIIGDCSYQCEIFNIQNILIRNKIQGINDCNKSLKQCYQSCSKLIRPDFKYFINNMRSIYPNSLFYIYTASEKSWALKEIAIIEKENNIKFNRPLFTREDCIKGSDGNLYKSVEKILPVILKKSKLNKVKNIKKLIKPNIFIIDNNPTFIDYTDNLLICPTYDYIKFNNLWDIIPNNYNTIKDLKNYISNLISEKKLYGNKGKKDIVLEKIHKWLYKKYKIINKINSKFENDTFWKDLTNIIIKNKIEVFNRKNIVIIRKLL